MRASVIDISIMNDCYVIMVAQIHFALTIALQDTPLSYKLFKKFNTCLIVMLLVVPIKDPHCLKYMPYLVLVLLRTDALNILTVHCTKNEFSY